MWLAMFVAFFAIWLVLFAAMLVWIAYRFVWERRLLGLPATIATVVVLVGLWIRFFLLGYLLPLLRRFEQEQLILRRRRLSAEKKQTGDAGSSDVSTFGPAFSGLHAGLMFGSWFWAAVTTVRWATRAWLGVALDATVTDARIRIAAAVLGFITFSGFFYAASAEAFASHNRTN